MFASDGLPKTKRSTVWKAIVLSKLIYNCATWGQLIADGTAKITSAFRKGLLTVRGLQSYSELSVHIRTDTGVRADMSMPPPSQT